MKFNTLKKSSLQVSEIGLGTNAIGGHNLFVNLNEEDGKDMLRAALQSGINFIDTADMYGKGRSEELIGEVLKEFKREDIILATKGAQQWFEDGSMGVSNSPEYLRKAVENSLHRLQTDYIDLYYLHFPDGKTPLAEAIGELARLKAEGKIRAIGISNVSLAQLKEANVNNDISVLQSNYNLLNRGAEADLLPYCIEHDISFIPYGPLAFGLLGGTYTKDTKFSAGDWRQRNPLFNGELFELTLAKVDALKEIAQQNQTTLPNLALAWLLAQQGVDAVIPGGKHKKVIQENVEATKVELSMDDLKKIDAITK